MAGVVADPEQAVVEDHAGVAGVAARGQGEDFGEAATLGVEGAETRADLLVVEGDLARRRTVQLGRVEKDRVEVINGLNEGQQVVTRGAFNVKDGDKIMVTQTNGV